MRLEEKEHLVAELVKAGVENLEKISEIIYKMPENIVKELYAIRNVTDQVTIWNARGSAYKSYGEVEQKLMKLQKENPFKKFEIQVYRLQERK